MPNPMDNISVPQYDESFCAAVKAARQPMCTVKVYPGEKHAFSHKQPYLGETTQVVADFFTSSGFAAAEGRDIH
jgi:hypothetical protein